MMNFDLAELTAAELRELMNTADVIRANKVAKGFKHVAETLKADPLVEWVSHEQVAQMTGMSARQSSNWQNANIADKCGLDAAGRSITKHYICEEDGSRLTIHKTYGGYRLHQ